MSPPLLVALDFSNFTLGSLTLIGVPIRGYWSSGSRTTWKMGCSTRTDPLRLSARVLSRLIRWNLESCNKTKNCKWGHGKESGSYKDKTIPSILARCVFGRHEYMHLVQSEVVQRYTFGVCFNGPLENVKKNFVFGNSKVSYFNQRPCFLK